MTISRKSSHAVQNLPASLASLIPNKSQADAASDKGVNCVKSKMLLRQFFRRRNHPQANISLKNLPKVPINYWITEKRKNRGGLNGIVNPMDRSDKIIDLIWSCPFLTLVIDGVLQQPKLAHWGLVTPYGDIYLGQHWLSYSLLLDDTKPLPKPMLTYPSLRSNEVQWHSSGGSFTRDAPATNHRK